MFGFNSFIRYHYINKIGESVALKFFCIEPNYDTVVKTPASVILSEYKTVVKDKTIDEYMDILTAYEKMKFRLLAIKHIEVLYKSVYVNNKKLKINYMFMTL